jgi:nucleoid-associated protein YgaU
MRSRFWCILLSAALVFVFSGCAEKQVKTVEMDKQAAAETETAAVKQSAPAQEAPAAEKVASARPAAESGMTAADDEKAAAAKAEKKGITGDTYVVKKGDCLWRIAGQMDIYGDTYMWPIIYDANKKKIKNPNLIYPGQKLKIPREGVSMDAVKKARKKAGASKPYAPPADAKAPVS